MGKSLDLWAAGSELERVRDLARSFAALVRDQFGPRARRLRLFGSAARGDWLPGSDVDVLILLDEVRSEDADWLVRQAFRHGLLEHGLLLQPLFMAEGDYIRLRDRERLLAADIEREGLEP